MAPQRITALEEEVQTLSPFGHKFLPPREHNSIKGKLTKKTLLAFLANFLFGCLYVDFRSGNMAVYQSGLRASLDKTYHEQFWPVPEQYENCSKIAMLLLYRHSAVIKQFIDDPFLLKMCFSFTENPPAYLVWTYWFARSLTLLFSFFCLAGALCITWAPLARG